MFIPFFARDTTCSPENPHCLSTRSNNNNATTASTSTTPTTPTHALLGHRNLVGILVIAALLALALVLSLCFAKWSKPLRRFLRGESRSDSKSNSTEGSSSSSRSRSRFRFRFGIRDSRAVPTSAAPTTKASQQGNVDVAVAEKAGVIPNSDSSQSSLDRDAIKEKASVKVALPAKVRVESFWSRVGDGD